MKERDIETIYAAWRASLRLLGTALDPVRDAAANDIASARQRCDEAERDYEAALTLAAASPSPSP